MAWLRAYTVPVCMYSLSEELVKFILAWNASRASGHLELDRRVIT